jgi:hypothetical protein
VIHSRLPSIFFFLPIFFSHFFFCLNLSPQYDEATGNTVTGEQKLSVPASPSPLAAWHMYTLAEAVSRAHGHAASEAAMRALAARSAEHWSALVQAATVIGPDDAADEAAATAAAAKQQSAAAVLRGTDRGCVQLGFDLRFVLGVLTGTASGGPAVRVIESLIDPIDAAVRAPHVAVLLGQSLSGHAAALGTLVARFGAGWAQAASAGVVAAVSGSAATPAATPASSVRTRASLMAVAPVAPRFPLLPIRMDEPKATRPGRPGLGADGRRTPQRFVAASCFFFFFFFFFFFKFFYIFCKIYSISPYPNSSYCIQYVLFVFDTRSAAAPSSSIFSSRSSSSSSNSSSSSRAGLWAPLVAFCPLPRSA